MNLMCKNFNTSDINIAWNLSITKKIHRGRNVENYCISLQFTKIISANSVQVQRNHITEFPIFMYTLLQLNFF